MAGADNEDHIEVVVADQDVEMRPDQDQTGTCSPMTKEPGLDVRLLELVLEKDVVAQEDHGGGNVASCTLECTQGSADIVWELLALNLDCKVEDIVGEM